MPTTTTTTAPPPQHHLHNNNTVSTTTTTIKPPPQHLHMTSSMVVGDSKLGVNSPFPSTYNKIAIHSLYWIHTNPRSKDFMLLIKFPLLTIFLRLCEYLIKKHYMAHWTPHQTLNETPFFVTIKIRRHHQLLCFIDWSSHWSWLGYYCSCEPKSWSKNAHLLQSALYGMFVMSLAQTSDKMFMNHYDAKLLQIIIRY